MDYKWTRLSENHQVQPKVRNDPRETDPLKLNLPLICSLDYYNNYFFIPEWDGNMIILEKIKEN
jgi:hypothetical protein